CIAVRYRGHADEPFGGTLLRQRMSCLGHSGEYRGHQRGLLCVPQRGRGQAAPSDQEDHQPESLHALQYGHPLHLAGRRPANFGDLYEIEMNILLVNKFHYMKGGSERYYFTVAETFRRMGHEVVFFAMQDEKNVPCAQ